MNRQRTPLKLVALLSVLAGCATPAPKVDDTDAPAQDSDTVVDDTGAETSPEATFAELQETFFIPSCGGAGCHDSVSNAGGLDLESEGAFDRLMNDPCENEIAVAEGLSRVAPGAPEESFLYMKLTDPRGMGDIMPPWGAVDDASQAIIAAWIERGAEP